EAWAAFGRASEIERTKLPKRESGDIGPAWGDWIMAHTLLREGNALMESVVKDLGTETQANAYRDAGKRHQARPLYEETFKLRKATLGPDHPATLGSMQELAQTFEMVKNYTEAETWYRDALDHLRPQSDNAPSREVPELGVILHHLAD